MLTYAEIAAKTGVAPASIYRWTAHFGVAASTVRAARNDTVPTARAGARLKARTLAARLAALAERHIRELEASASIDADKLGEALELLEAGEARRPAEAAAPHRRRRRRRRFATHRAANVNPDLGRAGARADARDARRRR